MVEEVYIYSTTTKTLVVKTTLGMCIATYLLTEGARCMFWHYLSRFQCDLTSDFNNKMISSKQNW
jgi:hypothetical protein